MTKQIPIILILLAASVAVCGCARVKVVAVNRENQGKSGLRFYRPHPYLLLTQGGSNKFDSRLIWLPNTNEQYMVRSISGWGIAEANVTLTDGWNLTTLGQKMDSKIPETITALGSAIAAVASAVKGTDEKVPPAILFKVVYEENGGISLEPVWPPGYRWP